MMVRTRQSLAIWSFCSAWQMITPLSIILFVQLNNGSFTNGPSGKDLNVEPAWMQGITGSGVVVAIVDNGKFIVALKFIKSTFCFSRV